MRIDAVRTLIADDHQMVREALSEVLEKEPDIDVVGLTGDGNSTLAQAQNLKPDLVLMDIGLPDINGIEVTRRLLAACPSVKVLAVSTFMDQRFVAGMLHAGAIGYVSKAAGKDELLKGIRSAAQGICYLSADVAAMLARSQRRNATGESRPQLGKRETEVLLLIAEGKTSQEIAGELHIAVGTVDVHRRNMMRKLNLHSAMELTKYAIREGLVTP